MASDTTPPPTKRAASAHGMSGRKSWDAYFMGIAVEVSKRATCDRKHVGCVLVRNRAILATGYNGSIPGAPHCDDVGHDLVATVVAEVPDGNTTMSKMKNNCVRTIHAEMNAICQAARLGHATAAAAAYVNTFPCWPCFKALIGAGITRIVYDSDYNNDARVIAAAELVGVRLVKFTI